MKKGFILWMLLPFLCMAQVTKSPAGGAAKPESTTGIKFFVGTWAQLKAQAQKTKKPFFVDFYASWCGPCKMMAKYTFTDPKVGELANANFLAYKLDAEKGEGPTVSGPYNIEAYPTIVFFDANGKEIGREVGMQNAEEFVKTLQKYINSSKKTGTTVPAQPTVPSSGKKTGSIPAGFQDYLKLKEKTVKDLETKLMASISGLQEAVTKTRELAKARDEFGYFDYRKQVRNTLGEKNLWILDAEYFLSVRQFTDLIGVVNPIFEDQQFGNIDWLHYYAWQFHTCDEIPSEPMRWLNYAIRQDPTHEMLDSKAYLQFRDNKINDALETLKLANKAAKHAPAEQQEIVRLLGQALQRVAQ